MMKWWWILLKIDEDGWRLCWRFDEDGEGYGWRFEREWSVWILIECLNENEKIWEGDGQFSKGQKGGMMCHVLDSRLVLSIRYFSH